MLRSRAAIIAFLFSFFVATAVHAVDKDALLRSAVRIRYERTEAGALITGHGTAFGVDLSAYGQKSRRLLLSAAHNVLDDNNKPYSTLKVEIEEGSRTYWSRCRVIASDEQLDICLVEAGDDLPKLTTLSNADIGISNRIIMAGSPRGIPVSLYEGVVTQRYHNGSIRSAARIPFDHGDSGGPIYDAESGRVVGIAVAGVPKNGDLDHNIGLFVPLTAINSFLEGNCRLGAPIHQVIAAAPKPAPVAAPVPPIAEPAPIEVPVAASSAVAISNHHEKAIPESVVNSAPKLIPAPAPAPTVAQAEPKRIAPAPAPVQPHADLRAEVVSVPVAPEPAPVVQVASPKVPDTIPAKMEYQVQAGDSLTKIARQHKVSVKDLLQVNRITDPNYIQIGMRLQIP